MRKIPTLFVRDFEHSNGRYVTDEVTPGCEWVLAGEGVPTRKFDGTCTMFDGERWWARREVKGTVARLDNAVLFDAPEGFVLEDSDTTTGKVVGWVPAETSSFYKYLLEALTVPEGAAATNRQPGTYELIGPKINGDPEGWGAHSLIPHGAIPLINPDPIDYKTLRDALTGDFRFEGIVWHHPDGRMAKLKKRDFPKADA